MAKTKLHVFFVESPQDECLLIWESSKKRAEDKAKEYCPNFKLRYGQQISDDANGVEDILETYPKDDAAFIEVMRQEDPDDADWKKRKPKKREFPYQVDRQKLVTKVYASAKRKIFNDGYVGRKTVYQGPYGEAEIRYNARIGLWESTLYIEGTAKRHYSFPLKSYTEELATKEAIAVLRDEGQSRHMSTVRPSREQAMEAVKTMLAYAGDNPNREGLIGTPDRVVRAYDEFFEGYQKSSWEVLKTSFSESGNYNEMVVLTDIDFDSHCEHHMVPFTGVAHIAYFPDKSVVGISKLARLVEIYARRLQIQEKMTAQIADNLQINLQPKGVAVVIVGQHMCMTTRGVKKKRVKMITSTMTGVFQDDAKVRSEFMNLIGNPKS